MKAVITGATKGIGRACAFFLAGKGFDMALCSRHAGELEELKKEIRTQYPAVHIHVKPCDVSIKQQVIDFGEFCISSLQNIDILINNAGIFLPGNLQDEEDGLLEKLIETNLYSAYHLTRSLLPVMIKNKSGHIFNLCSVASINAYDAGGSYAISKFALLGFTKNLRHELKQYNIRVTAVLPGAVLTPSWDGTDLPDERFIDVNDVAKLIWNAWDVSDRTVVEEILIRPMAGDI